MISTCRRSRFIPIAQFVGVLRGSASLIGRLRVVTDGRDGQMVLSSACTEKYASPYLWLNLTLQFSWQIRYGSVGLQTGVVSTSRCERVVR